MSQHIPRSVHFTAFAHTPHGNVADGPGYNSVSREFASIIAAR